MKTAYNQKGAILLLAAITFPVILIFVSMIIDFTQNSYTKQYNKSIALSASLYGASLLLDNSNSKVQEKVIEFIQENYPSVENNQISIRLGRFNRLNNSFKENSRSINAIEINIRAKFNLSFINILIKSGYITSKSISFISDNKNIITI